VNAHEYGSTVLGDLVTVLGRCVRASQAGAAGFAELAELVARAIREFERAGYSAHEGLVVTTHTVDVREPR